jgi:hypothetical protein
MTTGCAGESPVCGTTCWPSIWAVDAALERCGGSLIGAIDSLRGDGRSLVPFEPPQLNAVEEDVLAENPALDPERPARGRWRKGLGRLLPGRSG